MKLFLILGIGPASEKWEVYDCSQYISAARAKAEMLPYGVKWRIEEVEFGGGNLVDEGESVSPQQLPALTSCGPVRGSFFGPIGDGIVNPVLVEYVADRKNVRFCGDEVFIATPRRRQ